MEILTFCDYYLPGYKAGGPIKTLANMVEFLGKEHRFRVVTRDRDLGENSPYPGVPSDTWVPVGRARVRYLPPSSLSLRGLHRVLSSTPHDVLYLNSMFSPRFTIRTLLLRRLGLIPEVPTVLAPRGELARAALGIDAFKKKPYLRVASSLGLYRDLTWHVSTDRERRDLERWMATWRNDRASDPTVVVAPDLPNPGPAPALPPRPKKRNSLEVVFLSRISRMKNLEGALEILQGIEAEVRFHIYGPREEEDVWRRCEERIRTLPGNITVEYHGAVEATAVHDTLGKHHLFFLPSLGENFGHVILEALLAGCPALISDRTPWRDMEERGLGWDVPLDRVDLFREVLQRCAGMSEEELAVLSRRAHEGASRYLSDHTAWEQNRGLFRRALAARAAHTSAGK